MGLILRLLQIVLISAQLLKVATAGSIIPTMTTTPPNTEARTNSFSVNITTSQQGSHSSVVPQIPLSTQSLRTTQSISATLNATTITSLPAPSSLQSSSDNGTSPLSTPTTVNTTSRKSSSVGAVTPASSFVRALTSSPTSSTSLPDIASQSTPSLDLNATESKAPSNINSVPNETPYATSPMTTTNSGPATTQAVCFTCSHTSFTILVTPTTVDSSPKQNTTTSGLPASSTLQSFIDKRISPLRMSTAIYTTSRESQNAGSVTTTTPQVQNALTSYSTSSTFLPESASQSRTSSGLIATKSKASSNTAGVPKQTLSINSSHATSPMTLTNSGPATTQAVYSAQAVYSSCVSCNHTMKESSTVPVTHTTTIDSSPKQTTTTSVSVSPNWTDWSVDSSDCQRNCSNVGGTVTASRQCYSHTVTFKISYCTKYESFKKVSKCGQHCPVSGTELLGMSIYTMLAGTLLHMSPNFFGG